MDVSQGGGPQQQVQAHQQLPLVEPPAVAAVAAAAAQAAQAQQNQVQQGPPPPPALAPGPPLPGPSPPQQPLIQVGAGVIPPPQGPQPVVVGPIPPPQGPQPNINVAPAVIQQPQVCRDDNGYGVVSDGLYPPNSSEYDQFHHSYHIGTSSTP